MVRYYYKGKRSNLKIGTKILGLILFLGGFGILLYIFFPLISWQVYFAPVFASQKVESPIPTNTIVNSGQITDLLDFATGSLSRDYTNANNWYPNFKAGDGATTVSQYTISIPKIKLDQAVISTKDYDLTKHLIQYNRDSLPPEKGNNIIFGHSTLPQLFDPNNYKTILANAYKIDVGDYIFVDINRVTYAYKVQSVTVVEPNNTSVLQQNFSESYLTIITCTPPGTIWKRLIIRAKIVDN